MVNVSGDFLELDIEFIATFGESFFVGGLASTPAGVGMDLIKNSGDVASLNPRLIAVMPPASRHIEVS